MWVVREWTGPAIDQLVLGEGHGVRLCHRHNTPSDGRLRILRPHAVADPSKNGALELLKLGHWTGAVTKPRFNDGSSFDVLEFLDVFNMHTGALDLPGTQGCRTYGSLPSIPDRGIRAHWRMGSDLQGLMRPGIAMKVKWSHCWHLGLPPPGQPFWVGAGQPASW